MADTPNDFAAEADRFVQDLEAGASIVEALEAANDVIHHPEVVRAGTDMLAATGTIDMKQLAQDAGMSRASLYRYYPDRAKVEAEIAGACVEGMLAAASGHDTPAAKFRAAGRYLVDNPGEAAAVVPFAAMVSVRVLGTTVDTIMGDHCTAPMIVGIAVMAATPGRRDDDVESIHRYIDECAALLH